MSDDWDAVAADVAEGLAEAGTAAAIVRAGASTGPAYDPIPGVDVEYPCVVVFDQWKNSEIDGTMIRRGDLKVLVGASGLSIEPGPDDRFKHGGKTYAIINVMPLAPAGTVAMWELQVRA